MRPFFSVVVSAMVACGGSPETHVPPVTSSPPGVDGGQPDAGPSVFSAQISYYFATSVSCTPPSPGNFAEHCTASNPRVAEVFRPRILTDYPDCKISGYDTGLVSIDCPNTCIQRGEVACGLQNLPVWDCPSEKSTSTFSCSWFAY